MSKAQYQLRILVAMLCFAVAPAVSVRGGHNEQVMSQLSMAQRRELSELTALLPQSLAEIAKDLAAERIRKRTEEVLALDSLAIGTRTVDGDGRAAIHRFLLAELARLEPHGVKVIGSLRGSIAVPVSVDRLLDPDQRAVPSAIAVDGQSWNTTPLWPNGPMPSLCPAEGIEGSLVAVGRGRWEDVKGLDVEGCIAVMDFAGGRNWDRLSMLGVQAVIVVEDDWVNTENALRLFCSTPVPFPRFFVDRKTGADLKALASRREKTDGGIWRVTPGKRCRLTGGSIYENRPTESIFVYLPPTAPVTYDIREDDLLKRIAVEHGISASDLMAENGLTSPVLETGRKLNIPGRLEVYTVRPNDLRNRLAKQYTFGANSLMKLNPQLKGELVAGQTLSIPNINDTIVMVTRIDSISVAPDAPHGAHVAANLAISLGFMEHLATSDTVRRRKGILFAFMDGDSYGGRASRAFGEHVLLGKGELKSSISETEEAGAGMFRFFAILGCTIVLTALGLLAGRALSRRDTVKPWVPSLVSVGLAVAGLLLGIFVPLSSEEDGEPGTVKSTEELRVENYDNVIGWLSNPETVELSDAALKWFATEWLLAKVEKERVAMAEARIEFVKSELNADSAATESGHKQQRKVLEEKISFLSKLRDSTFHSKQLSAQEGMAAFRARITDPEVALRMQEFGLTSDALLARLRAELREDQEARALTENNLKVVKDVMAALHPDPSDPDSRAESAVPGWLLDLSGGARTITGQSANDARGMGNPADGICKKLEPHFFNLAAVAAATAGWPEQWTFIGSAQYTDFVKMRNMPVPSRYAEFLVPGGILLGDLTTVNDRRTHLDTPADLIGSVNFDNLHVQARTALLFLKAGLENDLYSGSTKSNASSLKYGRIVGGTVRFNIRSGIDAKDPVPHATVYYPAIRGNAVAYPFNRMAYAGGRYGIVILSKLNGSFSLPIEVHQFVKRKGFPRIYAYHLNRKTALFDMAADRAPIGTKKQSLDFKLLSGRDKDQKIILTPVYPLSVFFGVDPGNYGSLPAAGTSDENALEIMDAVLNGPPRHYALDNPMIHHGEAELSSTILYLPQGRRARITLEQRAQSRVLLCGTMGEAKEDKGDGYLVGPTAEGDRNTAMSMTTLSIASDYHNAANKRCRQYRAYGIRSQLLEDAIERSSDKLAKAATLVDRREWRSAIGRARESWGILIKNYPRIMRLGRESVFSVVFLMALLVPASAFLERLLIGAKNILAQLIGATCIFAAGAAFLNFTHPAFRVAVSPFIVMIAFVMILMSAFVLSLCYQRFEVLVRRARIEGGEAESEEIGLASSLGTAFSLGVSNLKKRPTRTALTVFTVSVLTFSIITFVSVKGENAVVTRHLEIDNDLDGEKIEVEKPRYDGVLFRQPNWAAVGTGLGSALDTEYGTRYRIARRAAYVTSEGGNNADREGANEIELRRGKESTIVNAVLAFEPVEREFSQLQTTVSGGQWFKAEDPRQGITGHRFHIIIPRKAAAELGITEEMIHGKDGKLLPDPDLPEVVLLSAKWRVIGIFDPDKANRIRDINGRSLSVVDFLRSGITPSTGSASLLNESETYHTNWKGMVMIPLAASKDIGCPLKSIAVKFNDGDNADEFLSDMALRREGEAFSCIDGQVSLLTTRVKRSVGGLAKIIVPIILCVLIVANTMMGTVDERRGEVEMLGAVGLSPAQISFLLMSEATVFSVLGITFGVFSGLAFSKIMLNYPDALGGLSVNFTSLASTWLAMSTGFIVLLATLIPAKRAAAMAAPSGMEKWKLPECEEEGVIDFHLPFTLTRGNAVGMLAFFRRFMLNHTEATSADFNCRQVRAEFVTEPEPALTLTAVMWLAPYDLDVAQRLTLTIAAAGESEGVFKVTIRLNRSSGAEESWLRTNYAFMDLVRHQFLLWRNLQTDLRKKYIHEGAGLLEAGSQ